jgi:hypothetical protein
LPSNSESFEIVFIVGPVAQNSSGSLVGRAKGVPGGFLLSIIETFSSDVQKSKSAKSFPTKDSAQLFRNGIPKIVTHVSSF